MKWMAVVLGLLVLALGMDLWAEDGCPHRDYPGEEDSLDLARGGPAQESSGEAKRRGPRRKFGDVRFMQFRREVRKLGDEIRENAGRIKQLEEQTAATKAGPAADLANRELETLRRRQAELRLELARKKVDFALQARESSEERYQESLLQLEQVRQEIAQDYPDLE